MPGVSKKKPLTRQKRRKRIGSRHLTQKPARKYYRDVMHYALIDTNEGSGNLAKDNLETMEEMVSNKILDHIKEGGDLISIISLLYMQTLPPWRRLSGIWCGKWNYSPDKNDDIRQRIWQKARDEVFGRQNKTLVVKSWQVFHRDEKADGNLLVIAVDDLSMASLARLRALLYMSQIRSD